MQKPVLIRRETWLAWALVAPFTLMLLGLLVAPFLSIALKSISGSRTFGLPFLGGSETVAEMQPTAQHYISILTEPHNQAVILNTLGISAVVATLLMLIGVGTGYFMARNRSLAPTISAIVTYPSLAPAVTIIFGILWFMSPTGPVNHILFQQLQWIDEPLEFSGTFMAIVIGDLALFATLAVRMMASLFEMIDPALEDASSSLGATERETFFNVLLPLAAPGLAAVWVFIFIRTMVAYVAALVLGGGAKGVIVLPLEIFSRIQSLGISGTMAQICAFAVVLSVITLAGRAIYLVIVRRAFRDRLKGEIL
jgi:ABC-type spermidine/putrescine transport system permease subunit I